MGYGSGTIYQFFVSTVLPVVVDAALVLWTSIQDNALGSEGEDPGFLGFFARPLRANKDK